MSLYFNVYPGCWERHLQRQYNNPLFLYIQQPITQADVSEAQGKDEDESIAFNEAFQQLLNEVATLQPQVEVTVILQLNDRIDCLYEQCAGLGGDFSMQKQGLRQLNELIMQVILSTAAQKTDLIAQLQAEIAARQGHFALLEHPLVAHLLHPHSPINATNIIPTLLTENATALRAAMNLFGSEQRQILFDESTHLLTRLKQAGYDLPEAWQLLSIMQEQPLSPSKTIDKTIRYD